MSRIEEALKKVSEKRNIAEKQISFNEIGFESDEKVKHTRPVSKKISAFLDIVPIKVTNLLLAAGRDEKNEVVEEFNKLRSTIIALTKGELFRNTILVTSTVSEEGKSMTALNLAMSMAKEHDHTVLLVDTDLRRPSIHKYLGLEPTRGLVHCLRDNLPIEQALIKTGLGKLVILPAGEAINDPVDLLSSGRMKEIIKELKERYPERYVIFDSPPALPFADAKVLAGLIDATLFVVREGKANRNDIEKVISEFKEHNLLGVIYNDAHRFIKKQSYYYY